MDGHKDFGFGMARKTVPTALFPTREAMIEAASEYIGHEFDRYGRFVYVKCFERNGNGAWKHFGYVRMNAKFEPTFTAAGGFVNA